MSRKDTFAVPEKMYSLPVDDDYLKALDRERGLWPKEAVKHLPGQHDQDSHGSWARGSTQYKFGRGTPPTGVSSPAHHRGDFTLSRSWKEEGSHRHNNWVTASSMERGRLKDRIITQISEEAGLTYRTTNELIRGWSKSSNDTDERAKSMQEAAAEEFGVPLSSWQSDLMAEDIIQIRNDIIQEMRTSPATKEALEYARDNEGHYDSLRRLRDDLKTKLANHPLREKLGVDGYRQLHQPLRAEIIEAVSQAQHSVSGDWVPQAQKKIGWLEGDRRTVTREQERSFLRAMYQNTQREFKNQGLEPGDKIRLWRGFNVEEDLEGLFPRHVQVQYQGNAMESWSVAENIAEIFGHTVVSMEVPIENILSMSTTGYGCLTEGEVVVFGSLDNWATVNRSPFSYEDATKHLPGQHDQSSHGSWARGSKTVGPYSLSPGSYISRPNEPKPTEAKASVILAQSVDPDYDPETAAESPYPIWSDLDDWALREKTKDTIVKGLSRRTGSTYEGVNEFIRSWAMTSNDLDERSKYIQETAADVFEVPMSEWQQTITSEDIVTIRRDVIDELVNLDIFQVMMDRSDVWEGVTLIQSYVGAHGKWPEGQSTTQFAEDIWNDIETYIGGGWEWGDDLNDIIERVDLADRRQEYNVDVHSILDEMYSETQDGFEAMGYNRGSTIRLYRGITTSEETKYPMGGIVNYQGNTLESWSAVPGVAADFGNVVFAIDVPIESILCTSATGFGCLPEGEFVIFGSIGHKALVYNAPKTLEQLMESGQIEGYQPNIFGDKFVKHLPGQHDQSSHGSWAHGKKDSWADVMSRFTGAGYMGSKEAQAKLQELKSTVGKDTGINDLYAEVTQQEQRTWDAHIMWVESHAEYESARGKLQNIRQEPARAKRAGAPWGEAEQQAWKARLEEQEKVLEKRRENRSLWSDEYDEEFDKLVEKRKELRRKVAVKGWKAHRFVHGDLTNDEHALVDVEIPGSEKSIKYILNSAMSNTSGKLFNPEPGHYVDLHHDLLSPEQVKELTEAGVDLRDHIDYRRKQALESYYEGVLNASGVKKLWGETKPSPYDDYTKVNRGRITVLQEFGLPRSNFHGGAREQDLGPKNGWYNLAPHIALTKYGMTDYRTVTHEYGHWMEYHNPKVAYLGKEFLRQRTKGDDSRRLNSLGSHPIWGPKRPDRGYDHFLDNERTKPDDFMDAYTGKIYRGIHSEVISMGFEELLTNGGIQLALEDPEHWMLTYDIIKGNI